MLKNIIISLTENYHDLGYDSLAVDQMIDSVPGMGHRIKWGHDLDGMIHSFQMDGISGIEVWFEHIIKDFTTSEGIPLPFADAIRNITGMDMDDAIDWLCINTADVLETGGEIAILKLLKNNTRLYNISLALGTAVGIIDDNPLLTAYNAVQIFSQLKKAGKTPYFLDKSLSFINRSGNVIAKVGIAAFAIDVGLGAMDVDVADLIGHTFDIFNIGGDAIDAASTISDVFDGFATVGLGLVISGAIKGIFQHLNSGKRREYDEKRQKLLFAELLDKQIMGKVPPAALANTVEMAIDKGIYQKQLSGEIYDSYWTFR